MADDRAFTAAGVAAGIDAALHLAATLAGEDVARGSRFGIAYVPQPPVRPPELGECTPGEVAGVA
ncbi:hypothetical protein [Saccharomonospora azurea]|uniref:hypothetical protein n=1 Tax=Saccharomonospora azurea TaxID=40988 RepID=UPI000255F93C|nr:hypothetical protein [Saccharomonospora azurea]